MPVYASTPGFVGQRQHPRALVFIVGFHAVAIVAVMTAKMDLPHKILDPGTTIQWIPADPPPPPPLPPEPTTKAPQNSSIDRPQPHVPISNSTGPTVDPTPIPIPTNPGPIGTGSEVLPVPIPDPVWVAARFITPERLIKPPYPADKQREEQEASLRLRLSIDERGRVVAVEPVGTVDRSFFEAARRHLIANWRYKPATEDGHPVPSSTVITLSFRLA
ncbi:energy transducer TonB [Sphingomonas daechungensis]|uniref:energy transducer TonB n=1 Tax=Sphingomonas daechungensis TaxID=1176646 RepID=UPI00378334AC